ncbi:MAG: ABC transporter substrate-binding protein [Devosiaceae bacterium]|nr:ABC transporter substrate-binding protein [Devosiaceae bacterium MH13]
MVAPATAQACDIDRDIVFGDYDWASAQFHNRVAQFILEEGYGCSTDVIPGSTIPLNEGLARGDIDISMEIWRPNVIDRFEEESANGTIVKVGQSYPDAIQGWFVPRYVVEGDDAPAAGLTSVAQLGDFASVFEDPEDPEMGRFYNCIAGWSCEEVNSRKLYAYGLDETFTNFRPGTGGALAAAIESAVLRERPIVFYYWGPTWVLGKVGNDVIMLDEPDFDQATWDAFVNTDTPEDAAGMAATAYPTIEVEIMANAEFAAQAPGVLEFLGEYSTTGQMVSEALLYMQENDVEADEAAEEFLRTREEEFLRTREDVWTAWVSEDVANAVRSAL